MHQDCCILFFIEAFIDISVCSMKGLVNDSLTQVLLLMIREDSSHFFFFNLKILIFKNLWSNDLINTTIVLKDGEGRLVLTLQPLAGYCVINPPCCVKWYTCCSKIHSLLHHSEANLSPYHCKGSKRKKKRLQRLQHKGSHKSSFQGE